MSQALERVATVVSTLAHYLAGALLVAIMAVTVTDVLLRRFADRSVTGSVEITEIAMVAMVYLALAHAERHDEHVAVDLVYVRLPTPVQRVLLVFGRVLALAAVAFLAWRLFTFSGVLERGDYVTGVLRFPLHHVAWVAMIGAVLFALTIAVRLIQATRGAPDEASGTPARGGDR